MQVIMLSDKHYYLKKHNMKKVLFLAVATIFSTAMFAQTTTPVTTTDVKTDMKDLRKDIKNERQDKRQRKADIKAGNTVAATDMTKAIKAEKKDIRGDASDLKADGVKHPVQRANRQIKRMHH